MVSATVKKNALIAAKNKANNRKCERYLYNKQIIKINAEKNVSIYEAKCIIRDKVKTGTINA